MPGGHEAAQIAREAQQIVMSLVQRMETSARRGQFDEAIQTGNKIIMLLQQVRDVHAAASLPHFSRR